MLQVPNLYPDSQIKQQSAFSQNIQPVTLAEVPNKLNSLGVAIDNLHEAAQELNKRLVIVMASESPTPDSAGMQPHPISSCHISSKLDDLQHRVNVTSGILHSIFNRLAL